MSPGLTEILLIILVVFVIFGAGRVPHIMENLAKGINSFKKGLKDGDPAPRIGQDSDSRQKAKAGEDE